MKSLSLLFLIALPFVHDGEWELKKDKNNIKVYTKHVEGSGLKAIKATTIFEADLATCAAVLRDIDHLTDLFPDTKAAIKISQSENDQYHYLEMAAPWPVTDRDGAFHLSYNYNPSEETLIVKADMTPEMYPEQKGYIRLTKGGGTWTFKKVDDTHTSLDYYFHGEPGGSIPAWLANSVVEENPLKLLQNFHQLVKLQRYQGKSHAFMQ